MSPELRQEIDADPEYQICMLSGYHTCEGRPTNEHALYYANKKIQQKFAIVKVCAAGHGVDQFQDSDKELPKDMRVWVALNRATNEELRSISKVVDYPHEKDRLNLKYGVYVPPPTPTELLPRATSPMRDVRKKITTTGPENELDREARAYARQNHCSFEEARETLKELV